MLTAVYAVMHFVVDLICAWAVFHHFLRDGMYVFLIYNFCAFALQMPLGTLLDLLYREDRRKLPRCWTAAGVVFTVVGALIHPAVLGLGNALFHVGGGFDVIRDDFLKGRKGRDLGIFVAPGAIGLFLGTQLGTANTGEWLLLISAVVLFFLTVMLLFDKRKYVPGCTSLQHVSGNAIPLAVCCFAVVILRSFVGMSVSFPWRTGSLYPWLAVIAVALGKACGGLLAARFGTAGTVLLSLLLAAVCFLFSAEPVFGLLALWLFNMSMPVTLYLLACRLPRMAGFSFGLLTFGLFLGFLPVYGQLTVPWSGEILGAAGSILSAAMLAVVSGKAVRHGKVSF